MKIPVESVEHTDFYKIELEEVDSTNLFLKRNHSSIRDFTAIRADIQTASYGRKGRKWTSSKGGLWFSFIVSSGDPFSWIVFTSTAIVDAFSKLKIKWPNDLYYENKKVAGILSELIEGRIIVGVGLNVNNNVSGELENKAISLSNIYNRSFDLSNLFEDILIKIINNSKDRERSFREWKEYSILLGKNIKIRQKNKIYTGKVEDLCNTGELVLSDANHIRKILYGDIIEWEEL